MNAIDQIRLLQEPAAQAIGWALLQFVWQGALVGALSAMALFALRRSAADVRYVVATIGLTLMLTMPVVTAVQSWRTMSADAGAAVVAAQQSVAAKSHSADVPPAALAIVQPARTLDGSGYQAAGDSAVLTTPWARIAVLAWLLGVALLTVRLMAGWMWVQKLRSRGTSPAPDVWDQTVARLARRLHISRPIRLLQSAMVEVPTVIGWLRPVVLVPGSALAGMAPYQLEAILAHELAHIRRHDYVVNLLQTLVETLLFYHPAVWWLSHRIRIERENCCDDLAVSLCGDPYAYAKALADLEELRADAGHLALAATGGSLIHRVRRLIATPVARWPRPWMARGEHGGRPDFCDRCGLSWQQRGECGSRRRDSSRGGGVVSARDACRRRDEACLVPPHRRPPWSVESGQSSSRARPPRPARRP